MADTNWHANLEVSKQKGDKKPKKHSKYSKGKYPCMGKDKLKG